MPPRRKTPARKNRDLPSTVGDSAADLFNLYARLKTATEIASLGTCLTGNQASCEALGNFQRSLEGKKPVYEKFKRGRNDTKELSDAYQKELSELIELTFRNDALKEKIKKKIKPVG